MKFDLKCDLHPKYQGKLYPSRTQCLACKILYWLKEEGFRCMDDGSNLTVKRKP